MNEEIDCTTFVDIPETRVLPITECTFDFWHQRLRHPSNKVVRSLPFFVKSSLQLLITLVMNVIKQNILDLPFLSGESRATFTV